MSKIVLIGIILILVWIRLMLPFLRDNLLSDKKLEQNPIEQKFRVLLETLDKDVFAGEGILTVYDEDKKYMQLTGQNDLNVSYCFMYSTMNLTVQIIFGNSGRIIDKSFNDVDRYSENAQVYMAKQIEEDTRAHFNSLGV